MSLHFYYPDGFGARMGNDAQQIIARKKIFGFFFFQVETE
jgi:hypothetical protein